jgi:hypothetical protein
VDEPHGVRGPRRSGSPHTEPRVASAGGCGGESGESKIREGVSIKLYEAVAEFRANLDALAELDLDAQTLADTIEGMIGDVEAKLRAVIAYALELDIEATGAHEAAQRMRARGDALAARAKALDKYALTAMQATGISRVATDEFEAKIAKTPGRVVIDEDANIPIEYLRVRTVSEPDKTALGAALKAVTVLEGIRLVTGYRLAIK